MFFLDFILCNFEVSSTHSKNPTDRDFTSYEKLRTHFHSCQFQYKIISVHFERKDVISIETTLHCKYFQCKIYRFSMCPTIHCTHTVLFTFNCCQVQWNNCKREKELFTVLPPTLLYCTVYGTVYTFFTCPTVHCNSTVHICSVLCGRGNEGRKVTIAFYGCS